MSPDKTQRPNAPSGSTSDFVEIADIKEDVVVLKNGSLRSVVEVGSMNFELKSPDEQTAIITAFQEFLNSIDFSLQMVVQSRKLDIGPYLNYLSTLNQSISHELLRIQAAEYTRFVKGLTDLANIMSKKFYIVVPFSVVASPKATKKGLFDTIRSLAAPKKFIKSLSDEEFKTYAAQLNQRVNLVINSVGRLGIGAKALNRGQLMNLFRTSYNPDLKLIQN